MARKLALKTRLTLELATLFDDEDNARMIATHAELSLIDIEFGGSAAEIWTNVMRQAVLQKRVEELIACARDRYENDDVLREAETVLKADPRIFDIPMPEEEPEGKSRAPQQVFTTVAMLIGVIIVVARFDLPMWVNGIILTLTFPLVLPLLRRMWPSTVATSPSRSPAGASVMEIDYDSGLAGGFAGGLVTGAMLSVVYHQWTDPTVPLTTLLPLVTAFFGLAVAALGWLVALLTSWFARLGRGRSPWLFNEITSSLTAGTIAGILSGPAIAWHFGKHQADWKFAGPAVLLAGILPGCVVVGIFIAAWDQWPLTRRLIRSIATSTIAAWIIGLTAGGISDAIHLEERMRQQLYAAGTAAGRLQGGIVYGLIIGAISGLVIGISIFLSRRWPERKTVPFAQSGVSVV